MMRAHVEKGTIVRNVYITTTSTKVRLDDVHRGQLNRVRSILLQSHE